MKRRALKTRKKVRLQKQKRDIGLLDSPLVKGLVALIPSLLLLAAGSVGISLKASDVREALLEAGSFPHSTLAHWKLAQKATTLGDYVLAESEYDQGVRVAGGSPVLGMSTTLEDEIWPEKRLERELENLDEEAKSNPSRHIYLRMAEIYWEMKDDVRAKEMLTKAIEIDPNDSESLRVEGLLGD